MNQFAIKKMVGFTVLQIFEDEGDVGSCSLELRY
jgi:hypothetical protein